MNKKNIKSIIFRVINITIVAGLGIYLIYYLLNQINLNDLKTTFLNIYVPSLVIGLILMFSVDFFKAYRQIILVGSESLRFTDIDVYKRQINMLIGMAKVTSGRIFYRDNDTTDKIKKFQALIGVVPDESNLYEELTGFENLCFCASLYGINRVHSCLLYTSRCV